MSILKTPRRVSTVIFLAKSDLTNNSDNCENNSDNCYITVIVPTTPRTPITHTPYGFQVSMLRHKKVAVLLPRGESPGSDALSHCGLRHPPDAEGRAGPGRLHPQRTFIQGVMVSILMDFGVPLKVVKSPKRA